MMVTVAVAASVAATGAAAAAGPASELEPQLAEFLRNVQYVESAPSALDSASHKTVVVKCPANTVVVGTGVSTVSGDREVYIEQIVPTETSVSVSASEDETGHAGDWSITARAVCAAEPDGYEIVQSAGRASSMGVRSQPAYCPHGAVPLGLGWRLDYGTASRGGRGQLTVTEARPLPGASVTISASEDDTGLASTWTLEAIAICGDVDGFEVVSEVYPSPGDYQGGWAYCPAGKLPIGGGFTVNLERNVLIDHVYGFPGQDYSYVIAKEDEDRSPSPWTLTVDAMCATPAPTVPA
jgi:hypothetical protein